MKIANKKLFSYLLVSALFTLSVISYQYVSASVSLNSPINASNSFTDSNSQQIAVSGSNVDIVYLEEGDLYYDNNSGGFVGTRIKQNNDTASFPEIAVSGTDKHLVWLQTDSLLYNNTSVPSSAKKLITGVYSSDTSNMLAVSGSNVHIVFSQSGVLNYINNTGNFANAASPVIIHADDFNENQQLAVSGSTLHVVWQNSNGVYYKNNTNNFASPVLQLGTGSIPQLAVSGSDVHFVWKQNGITPQIKYASLVANALSSPITLSDSSNVSTNPKIATGGGNVYAVWQEKIGTNNEIFFASSANGFTPINLSNDLGASTEPQIAVSGANVFVTWKDSSFNLAIYERSSSDGGNTFGSFTVLSDIANFATNPKLAISGTDVSYSWLENISGPNDVFVRTGQSNANFVAFDKEEYILSDNPVVTYTIPSKAGDGTSSDTIPVTISSTSDDAGISVTLTESGNTGVFTGTFLLDTGLSDDALDKIKTASGSLIFASHLTGSASSHIAPITVTLVEDGISTDNFDFGSIAGIMVTDRSANQNSALSETVIVHVTTTADPTGFDLTLTETGIDTGVFDNAQLAFMIGNDIYPIGATVKVSLENAIYDATSDPDTIFVQVTSTTTPGGISLPLTESGPNTGIFSGPLRLYSGSSTTEGIKVSPGDFITTIDPSNSWGSTGMITPNPNSSNGIIEVTSTGEPLLTVSYGLASDTAQVLDLGASGGGGGGIARSGLVVQALGGLAVFGGGAGMVGPPSFDDKVFTLKADGSTISPDSTLETDSSLEVGKQSHILMGFKMPGGLNNLDHVGLYANLGPGEGKDKSDTYIYFDKYKTPQVTVHDPQGFFKSVNVDVTEPSKSNIDVNFVFDFAKTIDNSNVVFEAWNLEKDSAQKEIPGLLKIKDNTKPEAIIENNEIPKDEQQTLVPEWIKSNAGWWGKGQINDETFTNGIGFLIQNHIINSPGLIKTNESPDPTLKEPVEEFVPVVPSWVKNNALWWSEDKLTDDDFISGIKYLLEIGIIQVRV